MNFEYLIKTEHAIPNNELEELAQTLGCNVPKDREHEGNHHYFFIKAKLNEQDLIYLDKLDLDKVVVSREEYDSIRKNIKISQGMAWLTYPQTIKTP